jgi:hypothetical protein
MRESPRLPPPPPDRHGKAAAEYAKRETVGEFGRVPYHLRAARAEV